MSVQIELNIGHVCNNRCLFCTSGQMTERGLTSYADYDRLVAELDSAAARGVETVTVLGGEPTLHKRIIDFLRHAVGLGFGEIVLFTNGARGEDRALLEEISSLGDFTWRFSIQGGTEAVHDHVTQRKGAFRKVLSGLETLNELGQRITVNTCVNAVNVASLRELPAVLGRLGVSGYHADMVRPHSVGDRTPKELDALLAPYKLVSEGLVAMLAAFEEHAPQIEVRIGNLPFCTLPDHVGSVEHGGERTETITANERSEHFSRVVDKYTYQSSHRSYPPACEGCSLRHRCVGVPDAYLERYGPDEFSPLRSSLLPGPRAHLAGTLRLLTLFEGLAGSSPWSGAIRELIDRPADLPESGDCGLKYDAYLSRGPDRVAWGFTINSRWEGSGVLPHIERFVGSLPAEYAWDEVSSRWDEVGGVLTLGVGFDRPDTPPRLKLYFQEDSWGVGVLDSADAAQIIGRELPEWLSGRIHVLTANLHPGGGVSWKAYVGGATPQLAAAGAPLQVQNLAGRMARYSPLGPGWYYVTVRLDDSVRYAVNKIYDHVALAEGNASAPWRDAAALFASAGRSPAFQGLLQQVVGLRRCRVMPTATALEDGGRGVDLYCAAWELP